MNEIETVSVDDLPAALGCKEPIVFADEWRALSLRDWVMAADDVILRYVFRNVRPNRHLEFGTWLGEGVLRCLEECDATVWTINVLRGESREDGEWTYAAAADESALPMPWAETLVTDKGVWVRTDAYGMIGRKYLDAGLGGRVCQIYSESREWDTRNYPSGFFDSAFIDGGHSFDVVANDTRRAIELVKPGGLIIWHDFCPIAEVTSACSSTRDVVDFISTNGEELAQSFDRLFWVQPSWLLFGIRAGPDRRPESQS